MYLGRQNSNLKRHWPAVSVLVFLGLITFWATAHAAEKTGTSQLRQMRAQRRMQARTIQSNKADGDSPQSFGLLVIPVDFADWRLPENWTGTNNLAPSLFGHQGSTLENYFRVASDLRLNLQITQAPLIHLRGTRLDYHDSPFTALHGSRALATEALQAVTVAGIELRRLDNDGPDGIPGSPDDDGQVDGILILHGAPGQENDTQNGLITPLQYFLKDPVSSGGVQAAFYAVASLQSGLGIWAHETGHLLGMEDRYDPLLHPTDPGADVLSFGGLGRFSLMASGAWGTGGGQNPALPDAYSCLQLGWVQADNLISQPQTESLMTPWRSGGQPAKVWNNGQPGTEFFLLETRNPEATFPFDAGLPRGQMLIYHVDETVPEGYFKEEDSGAYHLRVRLVEADNDQFLQNGQDAGRPEDSFPGPLNNTSLTPVTFPSSQGYTGPTQVYLENLHSREDSVSFTLTAAEAPVLTLQFRVAAGANPVSLSLKTESMGVPFSSLTCVLTRSGTGGGEFPGGESQLEFNLEPEGQVWIPTEPLFYLKPANPQPGATTDFHFLFTADGVDLPPITQPWLWLSEGGIFDFQSPNWVFWEQEIPPDQTGTRWHLWDTAPFLTAAQTPVLACTGESFTTSANWPEVQYARRARTALISPVLGPEILAVQLVHAIEVEYLQPGTVMDGGTLFWQNAQGQFFPADPVDGWDAVISPRSNNSLGGRHALADSILVLDGQDQPQWRCDVVSVPEEGGPWRLRLEFSSNFLWRRKGWFIAQMLPLAEKPTSAFPLIWDTKAEHCPGGLFWSYPSPIEDFSQPQVEFFAPDERRFRSLSHLEPLIHPCEDGFFIPTQDLLAALPQGGLFRHQVRIMAQWAGNAVTSREIVVFPDNGAQPIIFLEQPFPNPSTGGLKFLVDIPAGQTARLQVFDLRGRVVHQQDFPPGRQQVFWAGQDNQGRRLAAGSYFLRLDGSNFSMSRKVVLIR